MNNSLCCARQSCPLALGISVNVVYSEDVDATKVYPIIHMIKQACPFCSLFSFSCSFWTGCNREFSLSFGPKHQPHREGAASNFDNNLHI